MKYRVTKLFKDADGQFKAPGTIIEVENQRAAKLRRYGIISIPERETASLAQPEKAVQPRAQPKYMGGGWYEVNGEKIQGKENARRKVK